MKCYSCKDKLKVSQAVEYMGEFHCEKCIAEIHKFPSEAERFKNHLAQFKKDHIPERYNQVNLLDELPNPDIDHYISISNRTDGKTFNYTHALLSTAIKFKVGLFFISRNMMLRTSYQELINEVIEKSEIFDRGDFSFIRTQYYLRLDYRSETIALISDLNNATELKYFSSYIKNFPIIIYDEFLALETDYLSDEWDRLKTIYESIDRIKDRPLIHKPKILYLGNAVNFESPILHGLKIYNILEKHPINTARIYKYEFNVMLEMNRNENANDQRNIRAFSSAADAMTTGSFETNDHNLATESHRFAVKRNPRTFYVKLVNDYLKVWFNPTNMIIILSIESRIDEKYLFNMHLKDNRADSTYLKDSYFDERHLRRIDRGFYLFENNYSKNTITGNAAGINTLKIHKLIKEFLRDDNEQLERESKEKQFYDNYIEQTKKGLMEKLWG